MDLREQIDNPVKLAIISSLMREKKLRYSELMPDDIDNVLFNYHLQHLVKLEILDKDENFYSLSSEGLKATANITDSGITFPKFTCTYTFYLISGDRVLLQQITRTRWNGDIAPLTSKVRYGTPTEERANFRMQEKAGIETHMQWIGTLRTFLYDREKNLIDDTLSFVCYSTEHTGEVRAVEDNGEKLEWYTFDEAITHAKKNRGSGAKSVEILKRLQEKNYSPFVFEDHMALS